MQRVFRAVLAALVVALPLVAGGAPVRAEAETVFAASARLGPRGSVVATTDGGGLRLTRHNVEIPASHRPGGVSTDFIVTRTAGPLAWPDFAEALLAETEARHGTRDVVVLVHGFNTSFAGGLRRAAQIQADLDIAAGMVLFSWPAGSQLDGYTADATRAAGALPRLTQLLEALAGSGASRIVVVGHSLGARLVMSTLAGMRGAGSGIFERLGVVLLSPDIGLEEFTSRVEALGELPSPVVAYVSKADLPLRVLADLTGRENLASARGAADLGGARAIVVDVTAGGARDPAAHYAVVGQPRVIEAVNALRDPDLIGFAEMLAAGAMAEARIERGGEAVYVEVRPRR